MNRSDLVCEQNKTRVPVPAFDLVRSISTGVLKSDPGIAFWVKQTSLILAVHFGLNWVLNIGPINQRNSLWLELLIIIVVEPAHIKSVVKCLDYIL